MLHLAECGMHRRCAAHSSWTPGKLLCSRLCRHLKKLPEYSARHCTYTVVPVSSGLHSRTHLEAPFLSKIVLIEVADSGKCRILGRVDHVGHPLHKLCIQQCCCKSKRAVKDNENLQAFQAQQALDTWPGDAT